LGVKSNDSRPGGGRAPGAVNNGAWNDGGAKRHAGHDPGDGRELAGSSAASGFPRYRRHGILLHNPRDAALSDFPPLDSTITYFTGLNQHDIAGLALTLGILLFAVVTAVTLVRTRRRAAQSEVAAREEIVALKADVDRAYALLLAEPQVIVAWVAGDDQPEIFGDITMITPASAPHRVLAFGTWLDPAQARTLERLVEFLRNEGESFSTALVTLSGRPMKPKAAPSAAAPCCGCVTSAVCGATLPSWSTRHQKLLGEVDSLRTLVEALPSPIWTRDENGALSFVNLAYARAVEAKDPADAVARGLELLDRPVREELARACAANECYTGRVGAVVAGARRTFDIRNVPTERGSAGIGIDATEVAMLRAEIRRVGEAHRRTLDQLATGVAIFDSSQKLTFYNTAYRALWDLEPSFLDQSPTDSRRARQIAHHAQAARGAGLPAMEEPAARSLSRHRAFRDGVVSARPPHPARRHHAESRRRRDLPVRRRDRAA